MERSAKLSLAAAAAHTRYSFPSSASAFRRSKPSSAITAHRALVRAVRVRLRREDGQVPVEDDVGQGVDQRLVVDDQEHLGGGGTVGTVWGKLPTPTPSPV